MGGAGDALEEADPLVGRPSAAARTHSAASPNLRTPRAPGLLGREGPARDHAWILPGRQSLPARREDRQVPWSCLATWTLGLRPHREHPDRVGARALHQPG